MPDTRFDPKVNGYLFQNGSVLPPGLAALATIATGGIFGVGATVATGLATGLAGVGVCGGMSWSALDFFHYQAERVPTYQNKNFPGGLLAKGFRPSPGSSTLYDYVWRRQMDSVNANLGGFLLALSQVPKTSENFEAYKKWIDRGQPAPLALPTKGAWVGDGHQVVGIGYQESGGVRDLIIYDNNYPRWVCMLRIERDDTLREYLARRVGGGWEPADATDDVWKGFWIADGYTPGAPPWDLDDLALVGDIVCPMVVDDGAEFSVLFDVANVGEFGVDLGELGVRIRPEGLNVAWRVGASMKVGQPLDVGRTHKTEIKLSLPAGTYEIEPVFSTFDGDPMRALGARRRVSSVAGYPKSSALRVRPARGASVVSTVYGATKSAPTVIDPQRPYVREVKEYLIDAKLVVEDDYYGGGTFTGTIESAKVALDGGALRKLVLTFSGRTGTITAAYDPIAGQKETGFEVVVRDSANAAYRAHLTLPCADESRVSFVLHPDLTIDPFGPGPFNGIDVFGGGLGPRVIRPRR
ncbi:MAG: hypothetical protein JWM10_780 [Myxococcaceae bacterium]|nr:hypothetical protein [Myxococcaceae bacterium]